MSSLEFDQTVRTEDLPNPVGPLAAPTHLRFEQFPPGNVLGGHTSTPRVSWEIPRAPAEWRAGVAQAEIVPVGPSGTPIGEATLHTLERADGVLVPWPGKPVTSREAVQVRIRIAGEAQECGGVEAAGGQSGASRVAAEPGGADWSPWSEPITWETGLLEPVDWVAFPAGPGWPENPESDRRPAKVRHEFSVDKPIAAARLYVSAHGLIRPFINGQRVGQDELVPGWSVYGERLLARAYDVTAQLQGASAIHNGTGEHAIGAWLADGWFRGHIGFDGGYRNLYGDHVAAIMQLEITHDDGSRTQVATGPGWKAGVGEILFTGLYEGEIVDARLADPAWALPGFDDSAWLTARTHDSCADVLEMARDLPVGETEVLAPVSVKYRDPIPFPIPEIDMEVAPARVLVDFGQNVSDRLRLQIDGPAGTTIRLRHAEVLDNGELGTRPLRDAHATDVYTLAANGPEEWEPAFTIHGFRYAEIVGWPGTPEEAVAAIKDGVRAVVIHTRMEGLGSFSCSDAMVTRLHENSRWSMRDNFVALPTDCPQRDERLGWTGDIQAFTPTAAFHYNCAGLLSSWLTDLEIEQRIHGTVPWYVPVIPGGFWTPPKPAAVWGDAVTAVPWDLYEATGDQGLLEQQWDSAKAWVDLVDSLAGPDHLWDTGLQLGDWLDPAAPPDNPMQALTDRYLVASAFFARSARILARWAAVLGKETEAEYYGNLADDITQAFIDHYFTDDGRMTSHSQTAYALAIAFDLTGTAERRAQAAAHLASLVDESDGHVATGFAGTPVLTGALTDTGYTEAAYRLLMQTTCPSWLYAVTMGATTTWERWDSMLPDGSINPGGMTSFNHYALGAVAAWLQRDVGGLAPAEAGYQVIQIAPKPGGPLTWAEAVHRTPRGWAASSWRIADDGRCTVSAVIPVGATAVVELPDGQRLEVGHGRHEFACVLPATPAEG